MDRRGFLGSLVATAGGVLVPWEPERVYSFIRRPRGVPMLRIFDGARPLNPDCALTQNTLLSEMALTFGKTQPGGLGGLEFSGTDSSVDCTGMMSFARIYDAYGLPFVDLPIEIPGHTTNPDALLMNTRALCAGSVVQIDRSTITCERPDILADLLG